MSKKLAEGSDALVLDVMWQWRVHEDASRCRSFGEVAGGHWAGAWRYDERVHHRNGRAAWCRGWEMRWRSPSVSKR